MDREALEARKEILGRMAHFYWNIDGHMDFPNSKEGDLLKLVYEMLKKENAE